MVMAMVGRISKAVSSQKPRILIPYQRVLTMMATAMAGMDQKFAVLMLFAMTQRLSEMALVGMA